MILPMCCLPSGDRKRDAMVGFRRVSAQIPLHGLRVARLRLVGVAPGVAQRAAAAQEVPEPVELDADLREPGAIGAQRAGVAVLGRTDLVRPQATLLVLELLDPGLHLCVV